MIWWWGARSSNSETAMHRDIANTVYNWFASCVTKFKVQDLTSGFRLVRLSTARQFIYLLPNEQDCQRSEALPSTVFGQRLILQEAPVYEKSFGLFSFS